MVHGGIPHTHSVTAAPAGRSASTTFFRQAGESPSFARVSRPIDNGGCGEIVIVSGDAHCAIGGLVPTCPSETLHRTELQENAMLYWAIVFFIVAIIAAVLGFGGIAAGAASIAQILFFIFVVLFILSLVMHLVRGPGSRRG